MSINSDMLGFEILARNARIDLFLVARKAIGVSIYETNFCAHLLIRISSGKFPLFSRSLAEM